jgi:formate dehydrogenase major subunit
MKRRLREGAKLIVVDPRRIDLVNSSPHVKADAPPAAQARHQRGVITALAHVVVTEGLLATGYIAERCDEKSFQRVERDFVARPENSPEAMAGRDRRAGGRAARPPRACTRTAGNSAIYYGLGVTEHAQGSTMVMGIANLAMATGNVGREGVGVNPLRGQNNVQGSCDMGSFPHELPGYRHISDTTCAASSKAPGASRSTPSRACASPTCSTPRWLAASRACTARARTSCSPTRTRSMWPPRMMAMECIVVQDIFLNETAKYAHVFLPGSSFLEKDGTFTNAERRISRVRQVMPPLAGLADWEVTQMLSNALGYPMHYSHPQEIMAEIAALTPSFARRELRQDRQPGQRAVAVQRRHRGARHAIMHVDGFVRGKGRFIITQYVATDEKVTRASRCC